MVAACLAEDVAWELAAGQLAGVEARRAGEHLDGCPTCRRWVSELARAAAADTPPTAEPSLPETLPIAEPAAPIAAGELLGAYEVRAHVGSGGMSLVYAAFDPHLGRAVALKVLRPGRATPTMKARLMREAQAMARLSHPNVL
ncbi:MAG: serine/threonine protein kinase, partial [Myxococcaceae bacterium]|nr:serine/threonine protein kinase [Myxococcaceae bacterium]